MPAPWNAHAVARIIGELHGQETVNVMHFATNSSVNDTTAIALLIALATAIMQCVETVLLPAVTSDWNVTKVEAQYIGTVIANTTTDPIAVGPTGSGQGELGPTSVSFAAPLVNNRSGKKGRNGRGRWFFPPPGEADITNSTISDPQLTLFVQFLNCLLSKFRFPGATTDWRLGVYSRKLGGGVFGNFDAAFSETVNLDISNKLAVIGRRRVGRGD